MRLVTNLGTTPEKSQNQESSLNKSLPNGRRPGRPSKMHTPPRLSINPIGKRPGRPSRMRTTSESQIKTNKNNSKLNESLLDDQSMENEETELELNQITKSLASEALEALKTTPKPVTVAIENLVDADKLVKCEPLESITSQIEQSRDSMRTNKFKPMFKSISKNNVLKQSTTNDLILRNKPSKEAQASLQTESKSSSDTEENQTREVYFKINFLNSCGVLSDADCEFLTSSLPKFTPKSNDNNNLNLKQSVNKSLVDDFDSIVVQQIKSSPFYSFSLHLDSDSLTVFVYIHYLDNTPNEFSNLECKRLIRLLNFNQFEQIANSQKLNTQANLIPAKLSKHLIEQLRNNVLNQFNLNKKDLMCISLDNLILERICFSTFQFYLNEFINDCILVVPNFSVGKVLINFLTDYETDCISKNFEITNNLIDYLNADSDSTLVELFEVGKLTHLSECLLDTHLPITILIFQNIYFNYSFLLERLEKKNKQLYDAINSIDYYYTVCLLYDLSNFLFEYMLCPKRFISYKELKMPWNLKGSVLNNLLNEQIGVNTETSNDLLICSSNHSIQETKRVDQNTHEKPNLTSSNLNITIDNKKSTIEFETNQLDHLHKLKQFVETKLVSHFDFNSEESPNRIKYAYLYKSKLDDDSSIPTDETSISILDIYGSLCQMFDFSFFKIQKQITNLKSVKYELELNLTPNQIQNILFFYKFNLYSNLEQFKNEYLKFYDKFFKVNSSVIETKENEIKRDTVYEFTLMSDSELKMNFIKYVHECYASKFCPIISTLANIYLTLPSLVEFKQPIGLFSSNAYIQLGLTKDANLTQQDISCFEHKSKLLDAYNVSAHMNSLIKFSNL